MADHTFGLSIGLNTSNLTVNGISIRASDTKLEANTVDDLSPELLSQIQSSIQSSSQIESDRVDLQSVSIANKSIPVSSIQISPIQVTYQIPKKVSLADFSNPDKADHTSNQLARQQVNNQISQRMAGGLSRINDLVERGETDYQQDIRLYQRFQMFDLNHQEMKLDATNFQDKSTTKNTQLDLKLKTAEGDEIRLSLKSYEGYGTANDGFQAGFRGLEIDFKMEGELSEEEKEQLAKLTAALEKSFKEYMREGDFDFSDLALTEQEVFTDLEFKLKGMSDNGMPANINFKYHDSEDKRDISLKLNGHKSDISIDKTSLGAQFMHPSMSYQGEEAKQEYLKLLIESSSEVNASKEATSIMTSMFKEAFENLEASENSNFDNNLPLSAEQAKNLIALPDFEFSFRSKVTMPNMEAQPLEYKGFELDLSLRTDVDISPKGDVAHIKQQQNFDLEGAFYSPYGLLKKPDFISQTYKYTQLEREAEKVTELVIDNGLLTKAISTQSEKDHSYTQSYENGKLVKEETEGDSTATIKDFTVLAQQERLEMDQQLLDVLIIDPFLDHIKD